MMRMEKKNDKIWAKRMHTSLKCYKENLVTLFALEKKIADFEVQQSQKETQRLCNIDTNINLDDEEQLVDIAENMMSSTNQSTETTKKQLLNENTMDLVSRLKSNVFIILKLIYILIYNF